MSKLVFQFTDIASPEDQKILTDGLAAHTSDHGYPAAFQNFAILARDEAGSLRGGATGNSRFGLLYVSILWVHPDARGQGLGRKLMAFAETEAKNRGCHIMGLSTLSFQAPAFYESLGFREVGRIDRLGADQSIAQVWYKKAL